MNIWIKLGLPLLLGAGAAGINWQVLQSQLEPHYFVKVNKDMKAGELFTKEKLSPLTIKTEDGPGSLQGVAIRWDNRSVLLDAPCVRDLKANDVVFMRDAPSRFKAMPLGKKERALQITLENVRYEPALLMVGNEIGFVIDRNARFAEAGSATKKLLGPDYQIEGPFRIVSVGKRVNPEAERDSADPSGARVISVAVKTTTNKDGAEVMDEQANRVVQAASRKNGLDAIVLYPSKD